MLKLDKISLLSRYSSGKQSYLSCRKRSSSSMALSKLSYHTTKVQTLKPISDYSPPAPKNTQDEPIDDLGVPNYITTVQISRHKHHIDLQLPTLPSLPLPYIEKSLNLLNEKIELCNNLCDFSDNEADSVAKQIKTSTLKELIIFIETLTKIEIVPSSTFDLLFNMIQNNLFRPIPSIPKKYLTYDDEPLIIDINWPHLQYIYQLLLKIILKFKNLNNLSDKFAISLISLLHSSDPNEREQLRTFFSLFVTTFPNYEEIIIKEMSFLLVSYREKQSYPFSITPILKFYAERFRTKTTIDDLTYDIFMNYIIPLVSCQHVITIYLPITHVCDALMALDQSLARDVLRFSLKHWPESKPTKQINYIHFLNFLVEKLTSSDFSGMCQPLFRLYSRCALTSHAKVVETSFQIWSNVKIIQMIMDNTKDIFPIVYPIYNRVMKEHWKNNTQNAALSAMKAMHDLDPFVFDELAQSYKKGNAKKILDEKSGLLHKNWAQIARNAAKVDKNVNLARVLADIQLKFSKPITNEDTIKGGTSDNKRSIIHFNQPKILVPPHNTKW